MTRATSIAIAGVIATALTGAAGITPTAAAKPELPAWFHWGGTSDKHHHHPCILTWGRTRPAQSRNLLRRICGREMTGTHHVKIHGNGAGWNHVIEIDDRQVPIVKSARLELDASSLPRLHLDLDGPIGTYIETNATVTINQDLASTLIALGWTPPKAP